ncbi:Response regulator [Sulfidibacter corallicola]|uniref:Response regulator n=1 Tax=Sulfidibacter corallicola TaxID=2818388 RepID=A0A8A4TEB0_SULCO|nr:response regulator [Sulfidibacter corallicola]QTD47564.1 response regulator [Sulfidibacter corallicola]
MTEAQEGSTPTPALRRVMYVEDEPDIQLIVRMALEELGDFEVEICSGGSEALARVDQWRPDLILLDVMMPDMDGPTTFRALREKACCRSTPIVFITAKIQRQEIQPYLDLGAADVIQKPFDPLALPQRLRSIWERCREA